MDLVQGEPLHELGAGEELLVVAGLPSEQREEIDHGVGQVAGVAVFGDGHGAVPLRQLLLVFPQDAGQMGEFR